MKCKHKTCAKVIRKIFKCLDCKEILIYHKGNIYEEDYYFKNIYPHRNAKIKGLKGEVFYG